MRQASLFMCVGKSVDDGRHLIRTFTRTILAKARSSCTQVNAGLFLCPRHKHKAQSLPDTLHSLLHVPGVASSSVSEGEGCLGLMERKDIETMLDEVKLYMWTL